MIFGLPNPFKTGKDLQLADVVIEYQKEEIRALKSEVERLRSRSSGPPFESVATTFPAEDLLGEVKDKVVAEMAEMLSEEAFQALRLIMRPSPQDRSPKIHAAMDMSMPAMMVRINIPEMQRDVHVMTDRRF